MTNNGLTDARSVLVTVDSPATPVNPNPVYAIGNLEPDDFSSFEVTYTMKGPGTVPHCCRIQGCRRECLYARSSPIDTNSNAAASGSAQSRCGTGAASGSSNNRRGGMFGSFGSGFNQLPVTQIVIILVAIIALIIAWRKGLLKRFTDRFQEEIRT